jgi:hypothetical protein
MKKKKKTTLGKKKKKKKKNKKKWGEILQQNKNHGGKYCSNPRYCFLKKL